MSEKITKVPAIRFKGFTDPWEQRKLSEVSSHRGGTAIEKYFSEDGVYKVISIGSYGLDSKYVDQNIRAISNIVTDSRVVKSGELTMVLNDKTSNGTIIGRSLLIDEDSVFVINQRTEIITPNENFDSSFAYVALNGIFREQVKKIVQGGTQIYVNYPSVENLKFCIPSIDEQKQIGLLFKQLDNAITLQQRELDLMKKQKQTLLSKMFPKTGDQFPEIRFKGFTDPWEQCKLGEVGKARSGIGFPNSEQGGKEGIPFYKVSDMNLIGNEIEMTVANNYVSKEQIFQKKWSPLNEVPAMYFAKVGAAVMLNRKRLCRLPFLFDNNTMAYSLNKDHWDTDFAKAEFSKIDLTKLVQVGALPSYNAGDVESIEISIPSLLEQQKMGEYFSCLDNLITLQQRKLDQMKIMKTSLLKAMFV